MKKNIGICLTVLVAILFLTSASRPSVDGRAVVADEGVLPSGMFAKSVGYLPGDSVVVTNPATGMSLDVMILGSISSSEGIAIMLSPEAAAKLYITKGSNIQVKVTKKTSSFDEDAKSGILPITNAKTKNADPDKEPVEAIPETVKDSVAEQKNSEVPDETIIAEPELTTEEDSTVIAEIPVEEDVIASAENETTPEIASEETSPIIAEIPPEEDTIISELPEEDTIISELPAEDTLPIVASVESEMESVADDNIATSDVPPEIPVEEISSVAENEEKTSEIVAEEEIAVAEISPLAPILLVPVDDNPPPVKEIEAVPEVAINTFEEDNAAEEDVVTEEKLSVDTVPTVAYVEPECEVMDTIVDEKSSVFEVPPVAKAAVEDDELAPIVLEPLPANNDTISGKAESVSIVDSVADEVDNSDRTNIARSTSELQKNAFYIQIAVYKDENNVRNLESKYGDKYPLSFVKLNDEKIQAMIGPLSVDEYETVLLRFRKNGFKDAFVRKF